MSFEKDKENIHYYERQKKTIRNYFNKAFLLIICAGNVYYKVFISWLGYMVSTLSVGPLWCSTQRQFPTQFRDMATWEDLWEFLDKGLDHSWIKKLLHLVLCGMSSGHWVDLLWAVCPSLLRLVLACVMSSAVHLVLVLAPPSRLLGSPCLIFFICFPVFLSFFVWGVGSCFFFSPMFSSILTFILFLYFGAQHNLALIF